MEICRYRSTSQIEVRYAETDQMGVVHHSVYAVWFEKARTDFFKQIGSTYADVEKEGFVCPVLELNVRYRNPTHYGDVVNIETTLERIGHLHFRFRYRLSVSGVLCTTGSTLHCFLKDGKPTCELPAQVSLFFPPEVK
ncbi:acyl-CoA thioester hydrolase [Fibrobacter intestinalis]|uniref:Acyl-CoA thioester hydrolase n=1 Tax=Fibrobacter intestinalis TaxID=28122 RepID=A0A1M6R2G0_9BACT|nr:MULTISPECIES: thioesterase family protein [Fibrobacter]MDD7298350.1 thioesterase family protein [Fibrobacter intestinalis]PBC66927.1 acyl-CoA thioester hydrolase [Fibrobacter sp. UWS1]SHK26659.1 acyl-CoA thioester hydrolase [Fibrobacter intestinalis]